MYRIVILHVKDLLKVLLLVVQQIRLLVVITAMVRPVENLVQEVVVMDVL